MKIRNKVIKSGVWYTFSNISIKGLDFLSIPIFTRLMSQSEYGSFNNFFSWLQIVLIVGTLHLSATLVSARYDFEKTITRYITTILLLGSFVAALELIATQLFSTYAVGFFGLENKYIIILFLYAFFRPALDVFQIYERLCYNYKKSVIVSVFASFSSLVCSLALLHLIEDKLYARIIGGYIPIILICAFFYFYYLRKEFVFDKVYAKYALRIGLPYVPHSLAITVLATTDRVMITHFCGTESTALYSLAYTCALAVTVLWGSVNFAFAPWLGEKLHLKDFQSIYNVSVKYVSIIAIPVIGLILVAPEMMLLLGGEQYLTAMYVIPPVMFGCYIQFVYSMYVNVEQFMKKTTGMAIASILAALLNIALNYYFLPRHGYIAAAYTTLIGYLFLLSFHYLLVKRMHLNIIYNTNKIFLIILFVFITSFIVIPFYNETLIRYSMILMYLAMAVHMIRKYKFVLQNIFK